MDVVFDNSVRRAGVFPPVASVGELAGEVGMFSCTPEFVGEHGGPLTLKMLEAVPASFFSECEELGLFPNIDVRVHRLYPGDYPAVPGWHCDGEFRSDFHAQPDLGRVVRHSHIVGSMSSHGGGVSLTEFVGEPFSATVVEGAGVGVWQQVHEQVEASGVRTFEGVDGILWNMSSFSLHRASPARVRGWRLFFRASMWHKPHLGGGGVLARQEYVYRLSESKGW